MGEGELLIDGKNVNSVSIHSLRSLIGNVNQEAILFNDSFYNNITFGVENATMEQVIEAAKLQMPMILSWRQKRGMIR